MKYKIFSIRYILFLVLVIVFVFIINIIVDPYGVFETNILKNQQFNERYLKAKYLLKSHTKYNSYILGSSRVGNTDPKIIEKYLSNSKFYNYTVAAANMYDYYETIKWMIKNKFEINNIYMQLDLDNMYLYGQNQNNLLIKDHPDVSGESYMKFYINYLFQFNWKDIKNKILFNLNPDDRLYDLKNTGMWIRYQKEKYIRNNPDKHIQNEVSFHKKNERRYGVNEKYGTIIFRFKQIVDLCNKHNINLICFTTPHNHNMMDMFILNDVLQFIKDLSNIHNIYYFSGYNYITINDLNYYEYSHYISSVSYAIADKIFNNRYKNIDIFGLYIDNSNKLKLLNKIERNIQKWDNK
jgi:hypothetical protein